MSVAKISHSSQLNNHELVKLTNKMIKVLKLSAVQAMNAQMNLNVYKFRPTNLKVGNLKAKEYPSIAKIVADRFLQKDSKLRKAIRLDLGRDSEITESIRDFGIDMRSKKSIIMQLDLKSHFGFINDKTFNEASIKEMINSFTVATPFDNSISTKELFHHELGILDSKYSKILNANWIKEALENIEPQVPEKVNKLLKFRIHEVKCIDETNPESGHDEIAWGGVTVGDYNQNLKIPEFYVGGGFDDGDKKVYSPPQVVMNFQMENANYPKSYFLALALAEKDEGGFSKFIKELYEAIKAEIQIILAGIGAAAGAAIGAEIGGSIGTTIAGPLGTVIGIVAGAILGVLVGWIVSTLKDDIFPPQASSVTFSSASDTFAGGSLVSNLLYLHYRDHGGHYRVTYDWQLLR
jgi:hypothetical protein